MEEQIAVNERHKSRNILIQSLPEDQWLISSSCDDAKDIWLAVLEVLSQLNSNASMVYQIMKSAIMMFLELYPSLSQVAITLKTKGGLDFLSMMICLTSLGHFELDVKGGSSMIKSSLLLLHTLLSLGNVLENVLYSLLLKVSTTTVHLLKILTKIGQVGFRKNLTSNGRWQCVMFESIDLKKKAGRNSSLIQRCGQGRVDSRQGDDAVIPAGDVADGVSTYGIFADGVFVAAGNGCDGVSVAAGVCCWGVYVIIVMLLMLKTQFCTFGLSPQSEPLYDRFIKAVGLHAVPGPITENIPSFVPRPAYVPAGSRNRPTYVPAGRPFPAGWHNPAARPMTRPKSHYFQQFSRHWLIYKMDRDEHSSSHIKILVLLDSGCSRSMTRFLLRFKSNQPVVLNTKHSRRSQQRITWKQLIRFSCLDSGVPATSIPAGSINQAAGGSAVPSTPSSSVVEPVHADDTPLPPGHSLGSSENSTRFSSPSDLANHISSSSEMEGIHHHPTTGIFSESTYDADFGGSSYERIQQFVNQDVWKLVPLPEGKTAIGTKWILKNKRRCQRAVVVARIEAIRFFLAFASYMGFMVYQMDVKSAFLYGEIDEEVYVTQTIGSWFLWNDHYFWLTNQTWFFVLSLMVLMKGEFEWSAMGELTILLRSTSQSNSTDGIFYQA
ncbi:putative ribonuclease H-like domain-containing protein [Tanacetum coccineum]